MSTVLTGGEHKRVRRVPAQLRARDGRGAAALRQLAALRGPHAADRVPRAAHVAGRPVAQARGEGAEECAGFTCNYHFSEYWPLKKGTIISSLRVNSH